MRLSKPARLAWLTAHVLSSSVWLGVLVTLASSQGFTNAVMGPLLISAPLCVLSGVVLAAGTPWGLVRYRWVVSKWVLVAFVVGLAGTATCLPQHSGSCRLAASVALSGALVVSVVRPWGQRSRRLRGRHRARSAG